MATRSDPRHGLRWWLSAAGLSASAVAAAYFLDPERGRARRTRVAERAGHVARTTRRRMAREARYLWTVARARGRRLILRPPAAFAEGRTLLDRVESELFTDPSIPHGRLSLEVEGMTVVLRGQLDSPAEIARVEAAVRKIPGVVAVRNLLHVPGSAAPNKVAALVASAWAVAGQRGPDEDAGVDYEE